MRWTLLTLLLVACAVACQARRGRNLLMDDDIEDPVVELCMEFGEGDFADITSDTPLCSTSYIHCNADNVTYSVVEGALGNITTPYNISVPAVYNAFGRPGGPALAGAVGTMRCDCDSIYAEDPITAKACKVCMALQLKGLCDTKMILENPSYSCAASIDQVPGFYFNCGGAGPFIQNGTAVVDPATARVVLGALL